MKKLLSVILGLLAVTTGGATAQDASKTVASAPPAAPYQPVQDLVPLPDFIPGLGQLFVDPSTLPAGPFLAYDRDGVLVSTVYMIPIEDLNPDKTFRDLAAPGGNVDHVDIQYNAGHPGVEVPHAHIVLWHVDPASEERVSQ